MSHKPHPTSWTQFIQPEYDPTKPFNSLVPAIERGSTVIFKDVHSMRHHDFMDPKSYSYGLHGTPTSRLLEEKLAQMEGGQHALLLPSGLADIGLVYLSLLKTGDHLLIPNNIYDPGMQLARSMRQDFQIEFDVYDPLAPDSIAFKPNTKLIWVETPGSVTMEVADMPAIAALAHAHGVTVAADTTWGAGIAMNAFTLGADISVQALTKYQSGGSDVLMGSVITRDAALHARLAQTQWRYGYGVNADDCNLIIRSLPHLKLRYAEQDTQARKLARFLQQQPQIAQVLHPALPDSPGHAIWQRDFHGAASLFSVVFQPHYTNEAIIQFVEALQHFKLGFSWGGVVSLVVPFETKHLRPHWGSAAQLVRFYVGLEDYQDLEHDLVQALALLPT